MIEATLATVYIVLFIVGLMYALGLMSQYPRVKDFHIKIMWRGAILLLTLMTIIGLPIYLLIISYITLFG